MQNYELEFRKNIKSNSSSLTSLNYQKSKAKNSISNFINSIFFHNYKQLIETLMEELFFVVTQKNEFEVIQI